MKLDEAKQILKKNGYLLEDTDTLQDEIDDANQDLMLARKGHNGKVYKDAMDRYAIARLKADKLSLDKKIEYAQNFNDEIRRNNLEEFGEYLIKTSFNKVFNEVKQKALKNGFSLDYIKDVKTTMMNYSKHFDFFIEYLYDATDENNDLEQLSLKELLNKYADKSIKYAIKRMYEYYFK